MDDSFDPGPLATVDCAATDDRYTLVFVRDLRHPPEKVWRALTEPDQLRQWAPFASDRGLGETGAATLTMIDGPTETVLPVAEVSQADEPRLLEYTWGGDVLRWELEAVATGTRLTLRHTMTDRDFVPKTAAGWHLCLLVAEHLLDGDPIKPIRGEQALGYGWEELQARYAVELGLPDTGWPSEPS
jgi:uncharacterized protein YndB with AHSA1/START domain